ncbi:MAG: Rne/Rng family ribonuclease [Pseudobdellovibrionaceae bacterium]|jgi:ribonuclease E|nr:Rne/Rng family ribonuclease [Pseudobdellovibrionaceae bacterium]
MAKRMLIDATHAEETRVAVVDGNKLIEFDYESKLRRQLKGNIFLAKVTRVEPSLQAAFVNFGGNRHGFLPFSEIHPDYFRIPIADREALIAAQQEEYEAAIAAEEAAIAAEEAALAAQSGQKSSEEAGSDAEEAEAVQAIESEEGNSEEADVEAESEPARIDATEAEEADEVEEEEEDDDEGEEEGEDASQAAAEGEGSPVEDGAAEETESPARHKFVYRGVVEIDPETLEVIRTDEKESTSFDQDMAIKIEEVAKAREDVVRVRLHYRHAENGVKKRSVWVAYHVDNQDVDHEQALAQEEEAKERRKNNRRGRGRFRGRGRGGRRSMQNRQVELVGGEGVDNDQPFRPSLHRNYKIQEVVKRGQIMLIQVQKEERGNKGAAVTTYLSLPGRYCVLMPNSSRGGGVSRKIASFAERKRMREILRELGTPDGMSVILRTAGVERAHDEIKRDLDYLMRLWDNIRDLTLKSSAPALIYEEGELVKRAVRDIYASDIEEILVSGNDGFKESKDFMKLLMPSSVKKIKQYKDEKMPLFHRYQVENQIAEMGEPVVTLKSGGYLVINPTEALVSIDVNSGRATKERHIEETALKTNLEAADEVARQLRLRDLGGLVVIDFIDMEENRNNSKVERRLRDALSTDRARIQVGRISSFGLLELSRQRLNPSLTEAQFEKCPHCKGVGNIRSVDSATILALRGLEEEGIRSRASQVFLTVPNAIALYILNQKREMLADIERRYGFTVFVRVDEALAPTGYTLEAIKAPVDDEEENDVIEMKQEDGEDSDADGNTVEDSSEEEDGNSKGRRNRRGGRNNSKPRSEDDEGESEKRSRNNRSRGRNRRTKDSEADQGPSETQEAVDQDEAPEGEEKKSAPRKKSAEDQADQQDKQQKKPSFEAKRFGASRKPKQEDQSADAQAIPAGEPSNDTGPIEMGSESDSDADSQQKKKGWWNRLID